MKQLTKVLMLTAALCASVPSTCSNNATSTTNSRWSLPSFKFPSWSLPSWSMPRFSSFSGLFTRPRLSDSQKETVKKWALPVTLGAGTIGAIWVGMKYRAYKQNQAKSLAQQSGNNTQTSTNSSIPPLVTLTPTSQTTSTPPVSPKTSPEQPTPLILPSPTSTPSSPRVSPASATPISPQEPSPVAKTGNFVLSQNKMTPAPATEPSPASRAYCEENFCWQDRTHGAFCKLHATN